MSVFAADRVIDTDVLIAGGGLAGLNAAIAAREQGAEVLVVDKGSLARSGSIAGGIDHFAAFLNTGPEWDTREGFLRHFAQKSRGAGDLRIQNAIYCRELTAAIARMARIGNPLTQPDGTFYRTRSFGRPGAYAINFNGKHLKPKLARETKRLAAKALERFVTTNLLTADGHVVGATAFGVRTGEFVAIRAKATVLSTGRVARIFENHSGLPFNAWQFPGNTGAAQAMAFRAGATLANMEYVLVSVVPHGFSAAGLNALTGMGGRFINAQGEQFMERYFPKGMNAPRHKLAEAVLTEMREGRGPVYVDCRHLSEADMSHLNKTLGYDKDTLPDFFRQKRIDLAKQPLEVTISEGSVGMPCEGTGSGIHIDEKCASTVPGLYAAGDCVDQASTCAQSTTSGYVAGREAARFALSVGALPEPSDKQVSDEKRRVFAPFKRRKGVDYREAEEVLGKVMSQYVGTERNELGLQTALGKLADIEAYADRLKAANYHYLVRTAEVQDLLLVARIMARASLERKETRFGIYHHRVDYPDTDDANWCGLVLVKKAGESFDLSFKRLDYSQIP
ncbi:MAG: FAD-binding protein [Chloroflexi bacterium]|nr:FAD-binding protein [Chloroflexota bacterium]